MLCSGLCMAALSAFAVLVSYAEGENVFCDFDSSVCGFTQSTNDDGDWIRQQGSTPTRNTGPSADHTTGSGHYMFMESSNPAEYDDTFDLYSPVYTLQGDICVSFWYYMYGEHVRELQVFSMDPTNQNSVREWSKSDDQGKGWRKAEFKMSQQTNFFKLMFRGIRGKDIRGDIAIDDVMLSECGALVPATPQDPNAITCSFDSDFCGFVQSTDDDGDWLRHKGSTPTRNTGPSSDHTTGSGVYIYMESSNPAKPGHTFDLYSPVYTMQGDVCVEFWYAMYGEHVKEFIVYSTKANMYGTEEKWTKTGDQGEGWHKAEIILSQVFSPFRLLFRGIRGSDIRGDIAIDDIRLQPCGGGHNVSPTRTSTPDELTIQLTTTTPGIIDEKLKKRLDFTASYDIACTELTDVTMSLLQSIADMRYKEIEGLCSGCAKAANEAISISCSRDVTSITWPTAVLLPSYVKSLPDDLLAEIEKNVRSQSSSLLQMIDSNRIPPIIYPNLSDEGLPVVAHLTPLCVEGYEYESSTDSCVQ